MNDFERIGDFEPWVYERNAAFKNFLAQELREGDIVLTHYLPSYASIAERFRTANTNRFYVTDMFELMADIKPALWAHGHNHVWEDQMLADTRVISCPKGYPQYPIKGFTEGLVVEV
jgi:hypothetical protein